MNSTTTASRRIVGAIAFAFAATALTGCSLIESVVTGAPDGETDVFALAIGDCLNDLSALDEVTSVPLVDCNEPHDSEVFATTDSAATEFPGDSALFDELTVFCQGQAYTDFVGIPYADSIYGTSGYVPTEGSWGSGDRELLCTIGTPNEQTTGSLKGINQ